MKCAICRNSNTEDGFATVVLEKDKTTLVFKAVPAKICDNYGEEYISSDVNKTLLQLLFVDNSRVTVAVSLIHFLKISKRYLEAG